MRAIAGWPELAAPMQAAREACTTLRWHQALRRRIPEAAAESRVRGAQASAELDGARVPLTQVRDLMRGALDWSGRHGPVELTVRAAVQATAEAEHVIGLLRGSPLQALARLHVAAGSLLVPADEVGRPRRAGQACLEFADLGPAEPDPVALAARLQALSELLRTLDAPALVVAGLAHAEVVWARPFTRGNGLVARALERAVVQASGLDPTGVAVVEAGHRAAGATAYLGALTAYGQGSQQGVALWLRHCSQAVVAGAHEGAAISDAVLAGRLGQT
jgi:hypothetical protein